MDPNTFFQDRVLGRLYGEAERESPDEVGSKPEDTSEIDKDLHTTVRKVYTASLPPKDWCDKSSVTDNPNTEKDTTLLSTTESSSEQSGSDDISQPVHKRKKRRGKRFKTDHRCKDSAHSKTVSKCQNLEENRKTLKNSTEDDTKPKLTKNQKRKLKKKKRNEKLKERVDHGISKEFVYKGNEQLNENKT